GERTMATQEEVVDFLTKMAPADLDALLKGLEEKWHIAIPGAAPIAPPPDDKGGGKDEPTEFVVVLKSGAGNKINAMKVVSEITGLGLKDAKDLVDGAPKDLKSGVSKTEADDIAKKLKDAGAEVDVKPLG